MANRLGRVLVSAIMGGILLGVFGLGMREFARMATPGNSADVARITQTIPLTMAAWGVGVAGLFTLLGTLWAGPTAKPEPPPEPVGDSGLDPEVERLLNRLQAEQSIAPGQVDQEAVLEEVPVADERELIRAAEFDALGDPPSQPRRCG